MGRVEQIDRENQYIHYNFMRTMYFEFLGHLYIVNISIYEGMPVSNAAIVKPPMISMGNQHPFKFSVT